MALPLNLPFAFWHDTLDHKTSCILVVSADTRESVVAGPKFLYSGLENGFIVKWRIEQGIDGNLKQPSKLFPETALVSHGSEVTALAQCNATKARRNVLSVLILNLQFVLIPLQSASSDGTLCLWDISDDYCRRRNENVVSFWPSSLCKLPESNLVACAGRSVSIDIVNVSSLEVVRTLVGHSVWVVELWIESNQGHDVLVSVDRDGTLNTWMNSETSQTELPIATTCLQTERLTGCSASPSRTTLAWIDGSSATWWDSKRGKLVATCKAPAGHWTGCAFLSDDHLLAWTQFGQGYVYHFKTGSGDGRNGSTGEQADSLESLATFGAAIGTLGRKEEQCMLSYQGGIVVKCDLDGRIALFKLDSLASQLATRRSIAHPSSSSIPCVPIWIDASIRDGFMQPADGAEPTSQVTCSQMSQNGIFCTLVLGYSDGKVIVHELPSDEGSVVLHDDQSQTTALLVVEKRMLVVGHVSGIIRVYDLRSRLSLHAFYENVSPIFRLFLPPDGTLLRERSCFCAYAENNTLCLYSLLAMQCIYVFGGHSSPISRLAWSSSDEYLQVQCASGIVYVWELSSGHLERQVSGEVARDMMNEALLLSKEGKVNIVYMDVPDSTDTETRIIQYEKDHDDHAEDLVSNAITCYQPFYMTKSKVGAPLNIINVNIRFFLSLLRQSMTSTGTVVSLPSAIADEKSAQSKSQTIRTYWPLSYLVPWDLKHMDSVPGVEALENEIVAELGLKRPLLFPIPGLAGAGNAISIPFPANSSNQHWYKRSSRLSAIYSVSVVAIAKTLLSSTEYKSSCSRLITAICALLPIAIKGFFDPSPSLVVQFWQDPDEDIQQAARSVLGAAFDRMTIEQHKAIVGAWGPRVPSVLAVVLLGILGSEHGSALDKATANRVSSALWSLLRGGGMASTLAAELLGRGYLVWKPYIENPGELIKLLFNLALNAPPNQAAPAHHSLLLVGAAEPKYAVQALGLMATKPGQKATDRVMALKLLRALVRKHSVPLDAELSSLVELTVKTIDPDIPSLRETCLETATGLLIELVRRFPVVSFHQQTQRLAVGTNDRVVIIYDVGTATKWQILEGHKCPLTAVAFDRTGKLLASFSEEDRSLRIWQTGTSFFGMLGSAGRCVHAFRVNPAPASRKPYETRLQWQGPSLVTIVRGDFPLTFQV